MTTNPLPEPDPSIEERLARERAILQYVVDNVPAWIFWKDRRSVYLGCNRHFAALDGKTDPRELVGRTDDDMAWREFAEQYRKGDREVMEKAEPVINREELSPDGKGGQMVILTSKVPMRNDAGEIIGLLGILTDITSRKKMEDELHRAKEAAEEAARARGRFIASVSHELRTPLTLILGPVKEALRDAGLPAAQRQMLERVQRNGFRLYNLVNDILDFSRGQSGALAVRLERHDAVAAARAVVDDMQPLARSRGLALEIASATASLSVAIDAKLFERIVLNLVGNALKFTPAGGRVDVFLSADRESLRVDVADNGIGIPEDMQDRLFQPFVQLDKTGAPAREGSGLGLVLVRQFAEAMGGGVSFVSERDRGSTFTVRLPIRSGVPEATVAPLDADVSLGSGTWQRRIAAPVETGTAVGTAVDGRPRILVVEDNPDMREFIAETLNPDFSVVAVENGARAWERLQQDRFEAVLSDVMMPEVDGLALTARIKSDAALRRLPVILITARGGSEAASAGLDAGADDYVVKPFASEELRARVRTAVRVGRLHEDLREQSRRAGMAEGLVQANALLEQKSAELQASLGRLRAAQDQLVHAERLAAIGQLAAGVAHEINNPLAYFLVSQGRVRALAERLSTLIGPGEARLVVEEIRNFAAELESGAVRIRTIAQDLCGMARRDAGVSGVADLSEVVKSAVRVTAATTRPRATVTNRIDAPIRVMGDPARLSQVFVNLLVNAAQAFGVRPATQNRIDIAGEPQGDRMIVRVSDNGPGILPEHLSRMFEPFFTTKPAGSGTGLGLAISRDIIRACGGDLRVESVPGKGAAFLVSLPAVTPPVEHPDVPGPEGGRSIRVLCVDDERPLLRAYACALKGHCEVVLAEGGHQALANIAERPEFDLILCDINMPEIGGIETYRRVSESYPALTPAFVFMTGGGAEGDTRTFLERNPVPILEKPFDLAMLLKLVRSRMCRR